jgi:hypothetical protein
MVQDQTHLAESFFFILIVAACGSWMVSAWLLGRYRSGILRAMGQNAGTPAEPPKLPVRPDAAETRPLVFQIHEPGSGRTARASQWIQRMEANAQGIAWVYAAAGLGYATVLAAAWTLHMGEGFLPNRFLMFLALYAWPIVIASGLVLLLRRRERWGIFAVQAAAVAGFFLAGGSGGPAKNLQDALFLWVILNGPATLLIWSTMHRSIRTVGPTVLVVLAFCLAGALMATEVVFSQLEGAIALANSMGAGVYQILAGAIALGILFFGLAGMVVWKALAQAYRRKWISDQSIVIDSLWLLFALAHPTVMLADGIAWEFTGVVAFAVYFAISRAGWVWLRAQCGTVGGSGAAPRLLLLRVFSQRKRGPDAFAQIAKWWPQIGSVQMIAGPDLVTSQASPDEFLDYLAGNLERRFVRSHADLEIRLAEVDVRPDPDGLFRVQEFFCHDDTWKRAVRALADRASVVVMDLSGFGPGRAGCLYELGHLLDRVDLRRVALLIAPTTDRSFLEASLREQWSKVAPDSPNRLVPVPTAHLFPIQIADREALRRIFAALEP